MKSPTLAEAGLTCQPDRREASIKPHRIAVYPAFTVELGILAPFMLLMRTWAHRSRARVGGKEIGPDLGYGPARLLTPSEVQAVAPALAYVSSEALTQRFERA
jgi:hypothetical protein